MVFSALFGQFTQISQFGTGSVLASVAAVVLAVAAVVALVSARRTAAASRNVAVTYVTDSGAQYTLRSVLGTLLLSYCPEGGTWSSIPDSPQGRRPLGPGYLTARLLITSESNGYRHEIFSSLPVQSVSFG